MPAQSTMIPAARLIAAAKAPTIAYGEKNWDAVKASLTPDFVYDEIATQRVAKGAAEAIALFQGWAAAFPDSKATFHSAIASGNTVVLEVTWKGTHQGPLQTPKGPVAATGKRIAVRSCIVAELAGEKVKLERQYFDMGTLLQQLGLTG